MLRELSVSPRKRIYLSDVRAKVNCIASDKRNCLNKRNCAKFHDSEICNSFTIIKEFYLVLPQATGNTRYKQGHPKKYSRRNIINTAYDMERL